MEFRKRPSLKRWSPSNKRRKQKSLRSPYTARKKSSLLERGSLKTPTKSAKGPQKKRGTNLKIKRSSRSKSFTEIPFSFLKNPSSPVSPIHKRKKKTLKKLSLSTLERKFSSSKLQKNRTPKKKIRRHKSTVKSRPKTSYLGGRGLSKTPQLGMRIRKTPILLTCYLCCQQYGFSSLKIHIKSCKIKYLTLRKLLPLKRMRRHPIPNWVNLRTKISSFSIVHQKETHLEEDEIEAIPKSAKNKKKVWNYNDVASQIYSKHSRIKCSCGLNLDITTLVKHVKTCKKIEMVIEKNRIKRGRRGPKTLICYICGKAFGTTSLKIHQKTCKKMFLLQQEKLPYHMRRELPVNMEMPNRGVGNQLGIDAFNKNAFRKFNDEMLVKCEYCDRTFLPSRLKIHNKSCTVDNPAKRVNKEDKVLTEEKVAKKTNEKRELFLREMKKRKKKKKKKTKGKFIPDFVMVNGMSNDSNNDNNFKNEEVLEKEEESDSRGFSELNFDDLRLNEVEEFNFDLKKKKKSISPKFEMVIKQAKYFSTSEEDISPHKMSKKERRMKMVLPKISSVNNNYVEEEEEEKDLNEEELEDVKLRPLSSRVFRLN